MLRSRKHIAAVAATTAGAGVLAFFGYGLATGTHGLPTLAGAAAGDSVVTQTFTNVVTYTIPTVTVTVTVPTTTAEPPPPPPPTGLTSCGGKFRPSDSITPQFCPSGAQLVRTFETPETMPNPGCCGPWWNQYIVVPSASSASIVADPLNPANHVFRSHVAPGSGNSDESALDMDHDDGLAKPGLDSWYRFKVYLPPSFVPAPSSRFNWIHEFLDTPSGASHCPSQLNYNLALGLDSSVSPLRWNLQLGWAGIQSSTSDCTGTLNPTEHPGPVVQLGHWYDVVENIEWSYNPDGRTRIWFDGQLSFDVTSENIYRHPDGANGDDYPYLFYYRAGTATNTADVYFDDFAIGPSATSVGFTP
jgi:hypothetical protein